MLDWPFPYHRGGRQGRSKVRSVTGFEGEDVYKADTFLAERERKSGKRKLVSYLLKWHGSGPESNTWEPILDKQLITDYERKHK